ncbi:MAG: hypothetical protein BGP06_17935 [Rhizobiales bacterium 65-9]|nr:hypothetical protein [Hyphomicrobiales bacterium]OJY34725.1 MAG: hypothetical protein BGP06_17935 [Rhizobiales bacterium 65-9]
MTLFKKTLTAALATVAVAGAMTLQAGQAEARYWRYGYGYGYGGGALAAGIVGGLALGAIAASAAQPRPAYVVGGCYRVRRAVWSDYQGRYVTRRVTVCD